jgi:hypothetical protein
MGVSEEKGRACESCIIRTIEQSKIFAYARRRYPINCRQRETNNNRNKNQSRLRLGDGRGGFDIGC